MSFSRSRDRLAAMVVRPAFVALLVLATIGAVAACSGSTALKDINVGLPARVVSVDTTGVTAIRASGGNVFVKLTGELTDKAIEVLGRAGLMPPVLVDHPTSIVTFPDLKIATVAGYVRAGGVKDIAVLPFVIRIESSAGSFGRLVQSPR